MSKEMLPEYNPKSNIQSDAEMIEWLRDEVKRVKIQRNNFEEELTRVNRELNRVKTELQLLENYINRTK